MKKKLFAYILAIILINSAIAAESIKQSSRSRLMLWFSTQDPSDLMTDEENEKRYNSSMDSLFIGLDYERIDKFDPMFRDDYNPIFDQRPKYKPQLPRYNKNIIEPKLAPLDLEKRVLYLQSLLDKAIMPLMKKDITEWRRKMLTLNKPYMFITLIGHWKGIKYQLNIQPNYLMPRVIFLTENLYSQTYNISDFEYSRKKDESFSKLENEYELIYLNIKSAGLLRKLPGAYYPKSLLREYADQTGLTSYIQAEEMKLNAQLEHDILAEQFFGSYDQWMHGFYKFLDKKIITLTLCT